MNELESLLKPLVRISTRVSLVPAEGPLPVICSKFGGTPYAESGDVWPECPSCKKSLSFICQLDLEQSHVTLNQSWIVFFYCWNCMPCGFDGENPGEWVVREYQKPTSNKLIQLTPKNGSVETSECKASFDERKSLPSWDGIDNSIPDFSDIAVSLNEDAPWEAFNSAVNNLIGEPAIESFIGGYPMWIQGNETPENSEFIAQIDSETDAEIMWGDVGSVYLFLVQKPKPHFKLIMQCC